MLRDHGQSRKYYHAIEGYNGRLDALQAGILHVKLGHLKAWNESRRSKAAEYSKLLASCDAIRLPWEPSWSRGVYHLYVIRTSDRDGMMQHLKEAGIGSAIHYPVPLHMQRAYSSMNYSVGEFPVTESCAAEIVSLPMYPQLAMADLERVVKEVMSFSTSHQSEAATLVPAEPIA